MMQKVQVIKRDQSLEEFNEDKISRVVKAAGLKKDKAQLLSKKVAKWLKNTNQQQISSLKIKDKVLEELRKIDSYAADLFEWYEKTKEKDGLN